MTTLTGTTEANGTTYQGATIKIKNTIYSVVIASGKFNYVNILKKTANPFGYAGKQFDDFDAATINYKNASMKVELLKLETLLLK